MNIFETLNKLSKKESKDNQTKRKDSDMVTVDKLLIKPSYIYLDEKDNKIKEMPLSKLDSAGALINYKNPAKSIHDSIFH